MPVNLPPKPKTSDMKIMISLIIAFGALFSMPFEVMADGGANGGPGKTRLKPEDDDEKEKPQAPAFVPLYCTVTGGIVTVYCEYDAIGSVTVTDTESGALIGSATGMLGDGIMIMLPADRGAVRVEVEMNGSVYYAIV